MCVTSTLWLVSISDQDGLLSLVATISLRNDVYLKYVHLVFKIFMKTVSIIQIITEGAFSKEPFTNFMSNLISTEMSNSSDKTTHNQQNQTDQSEVLRDDRGEIFWVTAVQEWTFWKWSFRGMKWQWGPVYLYQIPSILTSMNNSSLGYGRGWNWTKPFK